jgi:hypothetical protein
LIKDSNGYASANEANFHYPNKEIAKNSGLSRGKFRATNGVRVVACKFRVADER